MKISKNRVRYVVLPRYLYLNFTLHLSCILIENNISINEDKRVLCEKGSSLPKISSETRSKNTLERIKDS